MDLCDKVRKIIADKLVIDESVVKPKTKLIDDLGADDLDLAELLMLLEEEFKSELIDDNYPQ